MANRYMEQLLAQIREKHAKERVRQEVENHIRDQKEAYMAQGLSENEAEEKAVMDMGDPVAAGTELDLIHKPRPAWGMLALAAVLCAAGVLLQYAIVWCSGGESFGEHSLLRRQGFYAVIGFIVLCIVYLIDYTWIAKYSRWICRSILLVLVCLHVASDAFAGYFSNTIIFISGFYIMPDSLLYLYIPAYGALLYSYRSRGKWKGLKAFLYLAAPIMLALWISHASLTVNLSVILLALFAAAQVKGWLQADGTPRHKNNYTAARNGSADKSMSSRFPRVWMKTPAVILCAAAVCLIVFNNLFKPYQIKRIAVWLDRKALGKSYVVEVVRSILNGSRLIGENKEGDLAGQLPNLSTDYMLTSVIGYFGILAAAALVLLILMFGIRLLRISICQSNQLGMIMGLGCSLLFFIQSIEYILVNLALLPSASLYLPLVSYSGSAIIQTCVMIGILLSIYRYQDVASEPDMQRTVDSAVKM